jgi:hypothetical protein
LSNHRLSEVLSFDRLRTNGKRRAADFALSDVLEANL